MQHVEPLLLNFDHKIDIAGDYSVEAERHLPSALAAHYFSPDTPKEILDVHTTLYFRVGASASLDPKSLQIFMAQLKSDDSDKRSEAERTWQVLNRSSWRMLLTFADIPEFRQFAPRAFYRYNARSYWVVC